MHHLHHGFQFFADISGHFISHLLGAGFGVLMAVQEAWEPGNLFPKYNSQGIEQAD
jgi:hypothetical protein